MRPCTVDRAWCAGHHALRRVGPLREPELAALFLLAISMIHQGRKVFPYTPLAPVMSIRGVPKSEQDRLSLIAANVLGPNRDVAAFLRVVEQHDPDLVLTLESDAWWEAALEPLERTRPHTIKVPLDNLYGMHLFSRFPLTNTEVRYLVEDDVPSIRTTLTLPSGATVLVYGVHPRPPAPGENRTAKERDAELLLVAREIEEAPCTTFVAGDLNDVAWSTTSDLFGKPVGCWIPAVAVAFTIPSMQKYPCSVGLWTTFSTARTLCCWI
ncbi:MAG: endonuclease/exonuclease/phosphatase family protein [Flavobacteriales bacterium]|nr:endonuclease/exonuclease/phosphatase family protein [Flavobacteriales bacterium]